MVVGQLGLDITAFTTLDMNWSPNWMSWGSSSEDSS